MKARNGFTLIELLIVVAIIAILAAIAVPNFLEAQTRSKVSRVKADMRSLATAAEAYLVDWNVYPTYHYLSPSPGGASPEFFFGGNAFPAGAPDPAWDGKNQITTPVSYITSIPNDVFYVVKGSATEFERRQIMWVNWRYADKRGIFTTPTGLAGVLRQYGAWRMTSAGPDLSRGQVLGDFFLTIYDPTNGTTSLGQIHRTQLSPEGIPIP